MNRLILIIQGLSRLVLFAMMGLMIIMGLELFDPGEISSPAFAQAELLLAKDKDAEAQTQTENLEPPNQSDVNELLRLLAEPSIVQWLGQRVSEVNQIEGEASADTASQTAFKNWISKTRNIVRQRIDNLSYSATFIEEDWDELYRQSIVPEVLDETLLSLFILITVVLFIGFGSEWLYWCYAGHAVRLIENIKTEGAGGIIARLLARFFLQAAGVTVFAIGCFATLSSYQTSLIIETLVSALPIAIILYKLLSFLSRFFLAPNVPDLRLVPLSDDMARTLHTNIIIIGSIIIVNFSLDNIIFSISPSGLADILWFMLIFLLLFTGLSFIYFWHKNRPVIIHHNWKRYLPHNIIPIVYSFLVITTLALWVLNLFSLAATCFLVGIYFPTLALLKVMISKLFNSACEQVLKQNGIDTDEQNLFKSNHKNSENIGSDAQVSETNVQIVDDPSGEKTVIEAEEEDRDDDIYHDPVIVQRLRLIEPVIWRVTRFMTTLIVTYLIAYAWDINVIDLSNETGPGGQIANALIDILIAVLIADLIWGWVTAYINRYLAGYIPPEPGKAQGPEGRMATLLPLLGNFIFATLWIMVVLIILSSIGVNIGPILAGAGVLGIAIGFGAQTLVRDIVAGIFFLIDDAFRVGEYIEMGELRGTVEGISVRSLRIRHHRGAVHTIPFGELKSITNYSRDWVIMKLEFRVPFDTDLKLVKKIIKKVGNKLKENEEYGQFLVDPLKSQGVRRWEEFNMVIGVKFKAIPGEQWTIRRDAYQGIRDEFKKNGIGFAERQVHVKLVDGENLNSGEKEMVMGAVQDTIETEILPPEKAK